MSNIKATVFEIKRFAVHDGDGIRTTVFLKGCPLKCVWCHNPEGIGYKPQLAFYEHKCTLCGECVTACPNGAHGISDGKHIFRRELCVGCGRCEEVCFGSALKLYGKEMTAEELLPLLLEDRDFYESSGGGVTISGGECLMQADFCRELLMLLKAEGIHCATDTCGYAPREAIDKVLPYTDIFLYDIKSYSEDTHVLCTGRSNRLILENLKYIDGKGKPIEVRIPFVPDFNDGEIEEIAKLLSELKNLTKVRVLPYHSYAASKYKALDMENTLPERLPEDTSLTAARELLRSYGINVIE